MSLDFLRETARTLLLRFGTTVTLQRTLKGAYTPTTGVSASDTVTTYDVPATPLQGVRFTQVTGTLIQQGDMTVSLAAAALAEAAIEPNPDTDTLLVNGKTWKIIAVQPTYAQSQVALYECLVRA